MTPTTGTTPTPLPRFTAAQVAAVHFECQKIADAVARIHNVAGYDTFVAGRLKRILEDGGAIEFHTLASGQHTAPALPYPATTNPTAELGFTSQPVIFSHKHHPDPSAVNLLDPDQDERGTGGERIAYALGDKIKQILSASYGITAGDPDADEPDTDLAPAEPVTVEEPEHGSPVGEEGVVSWGGERVQ